MAHFAKINLDNIVEQVVVVPDEQESRGNEYLNEIGLTGTWIQTSYNHNFRKMFASIGGLYLASKDIFVNPQPYPSWTLDEDLEDWVAPVAMPTAEEGVFYTWNEEDQIWNSNQVVAQQEAPAEISS